MKSIAGYDEYEQDFQLLALPEYHWMAEQLLIEAFEDYQPSEPFHVYLPDCLCGEPSGYTFSLKPVQRAEDTPCSTRAFIKILPGERRNFAMKPFRSRGRRIRPTDKDLVFHTALAALLPVFLLIVLLFHAGQLRRIDWQHASLSQMVQGINLPICCSVWG